MYRVRGELGKGPHIVAGKLTGEQLLNGLLRDLVIEVPAATVIGYRTAVFYAIKLSLTHGRHCAPPRSARVTPDAPHPTQHTDRAGRPVPNTQEGA